MGLQPDGERAVKRENDHDEGQRTDRECGAENACPHLVKHRGRNILDGDKGGCPPAQDQSYDAEAENDYVCSEFYDGKGSGSDHAVDDDP